MRLFPGRRSVRSRFEPLFPQFLQLAHINGASFAANRWGFTPMDEAKRVGAAHVVAFLEGQQVGRHTLPAAVGSPGDGSGGAAKERAGGEADEGEAGSGQE